MLGCGRGTEQHRRGAPPGGTHSRGRGGQTQNQHVERLRKQAAEWKSQQPRSCVFTPKKGSVATQSPSSAAQQRESQWPQDGKTQTASQRINELWSIYTMGRRGKLRIWRESQKRDVPRCCDFIHTNSREKAIVTKHISGWQGQGRG